ncbi:MAG: hypothetical protein NC182_01370 [Prevotella sp.]|nr:hypothetical protein [Staphylococcus sp.]MCM1349832.1 hypothetical protein [Prevotella sp.]
MLNLYSIIGYFGDVVAADELGKNWDMFKIIVILLGILPWIALIIYLCTMKYRIRYFVEGQLVHTVYYKRKQPIQPYQYQTENQTIDQWYQDVDGTQLFVLEQMPAENIRVYGFLNENDGNKEE